MRGCRRLDGSLPCKKCTAGDRHPDEGDIFNLYNRSCSNKHTHTASNQECQMRPLSVKRDLGSNPLTGPRAATRSDASSRTGLEVRVWGVTLLTDGSLSQEDSEFSSLIMMIDV